MRTRNQIAIPAKCHKTKSVIFRVRKSAGRQRDLASRHGHLRVQPVIRRTSISAGGHDAGTETKLHCGGLCDQGANTTGWRTAIQLLLNAQRPPVALEPTIFGLEVQRLSSRPRAANIEGYRQHDAIRFSGTRQKTQAENEVETQACGTPARM